ncbi:unnamed protein product [Amoebophrya sp. A120]|nr:unnamed protein product [Amoebophrya sp. A120]|eukprot:GSA120T00009734001.1
MKAENAGYKNCDPVDEVEKRPPSGCPRLLKPVLCYDKEYQDNGDGPPENYLFDNLCLAENDGFDDSDCEEIDPAEFTPPPPGETTSCSTVYPECSKEVPSDMPFEHFLKQCELACFGDYPTASYPPFFEDPLEMIEEKLASLEEKIDTLATQKSDITGAVFQNVKTGTGWFRGQETPRETPETMGPPPPPTPMPLRR